MRTFLKIIKWMFILLFSFVILGLLTVYVGHKWVYPIKTSIVQTLPDIKKDGFCLGVGCQPKVTTVEEFIPVYAQQVKLFNEKAYAFWPDNKVTDLYSVLQSIENDKAWLVAPNGEWETISKERLKEVAPVRQRYDVGFNYHEIDGKKYVYLALSEEELTNVLGFEKYHYLGTYDLFLTYNHEMFHMLEQTDWEHPEEIKNRGRNDRFGDIDARVSRNLQLKLILDAVMANGEEAQTQAILQFVANYNDYKEKYHEDYESTKYFDRIEGTAHYFEITSALYSAYPDQISDLDDVLKALKVLASGKYKNAGVGINDEAYDLGGWASVLLDLSVQDPVAWKEIIMEDGEMTPLDLLVEVYGDQPLPDVIQPDEALKEKIVQQIEERKSASNKPKIFRLLYQLIF